MSADGIAIASECKDTIHAAHTSTHGCSSFIAQRSHATHDSARQVLNLSRNRIDVAGGISIANALRLNSTIGELRLSHCHVRAFRSTHALARAQTLLVYCRGIITIIMIMTLLVYFRGIMIILMIIMIMTLLVYCRGIIIVIIYCWFIAVG